ncbi:MAG TPA: hypothetical protein VJL56_04245 [Candidatus Bathyarchaeia archaeon]|nr:hypothetical protein [Candidatus Bathyarchaeia archaeon]
MESAEGKSSSLAKERKPSVYSVLWVGISAYLWAYGVQTLYLVFFRGISPFSDQIYGIPPAIVMLVAGLFYLFYPRCPLTPGKIEDLKGQEMLKLIQSLDRVYEAVGLRYGLRILATFQAMLLILVLVFAFVFVASFVTAPPADKVALGVALIALVIASGSFAMEYVHTTLTERISEALSDYFFRKVREPYSTKVYPIIRAVILERLRLRKGQNLEDVYILEPLLFDQKTLLEKLLD